MMHALDVGSAKLSRQRLTSVFKPGSAAIFVDVVPVLGESAGRAHQVCEALLPVQCADGWMDIHTVCFLLHIRIGDDPDVSVNKMVTRVCATPDFYAAIAPVAAHHNQGREDFIPRHNTWVNPCSAG